MPGVLMLEALAQAPAILSFESADAEPGDDTVVYFAGIDNARFKRPVGPGDQLILDAAIDRAKSGIYRYKTRGWVDGQIAVEADLMCTLRKVVSTS
jgi:3-hydroxyacyl-[acyl-carrier-protein] dehydratase